MGAVLAMIETSFRKYVRLAVLLGLMAGCGTTRDEPLAVILGQLTAGRDAAADPRAMITPEFLAGIDRPLLWAEIPTRDAVATLVILGRNGDWRSWVSGDGVGLNLYRGILGGTRGLGQDLMIADVSQVVPAVRRGSGSARRDHRYLDGENHEIRQTYTCRYVTQGSESIVLTGGAGHATRRIRETCTPDAGGAGMPGFENLYWIGTADGQIWKSRQWVGPQIGEISLEHLLL
ncbi:YjbF family lipoprotein [Actibacterium sp. D379-3]